MKVTCNVDFDSVEIVNRNLNGVLTNVGKGTKWATEAACKLIYDATISQVPEDTGTLKSSAFWKVERRTELAASSWRYRGIVGYGGNGDPVNPKTGRPASEYMVVVHEDLSAYHVKGKAKFLEDPLREFSENGTIFKLFLTEVKRRLG
jgi:hypothetical protein